MVKPQQEELRRTGYGETDQEADEMRAREVQTPAEAAAKGEKGRSGPVPEENRPGHRPERDQDKPDKPSGL